MQTTWLNDTIRIGLAKLLTLRLDGCPPDDVVGTTADVWLEALTHQREWVEGRDAERFDAAFRTLARTCKRWPSPAQLLEALPASDQARIPHKPTISREAGQRRLDEIMGSLGAPAANRESTADHDLGGDAA